MSERTMPADVGIVCMEVYFPRTYVKQDELEKFDNVGAGKYTSGLGQTNMAFCSDREDINSISMTVVKNLIEKNNISWTNIGRLEIGTETITDKSKSVKTVLMSIFQEKGNTNIEGVDTMNACYGGTNALFNSIQWVESSYWDGRYALVVAADIAVYAAGSARPTGGCGAVAMLIGPNAPVVFDRGLRGTHMENVYDFYKPHLNSEYPVVDGKLSISCYLRALDACYHHYSEAYKRKFGREYGLNDGEFYIFHSPYNKLVQKSFGRLVYNDFKRNPDKPEYAQLQQFLNVPPEKSYFDTALESAFVKASVEGYKQRVLPSCWLPKELGNIYCGSLYIGLASLLAAKDDAALVGKRVVLFSYGSGLAASMFSVTVKSSLNNFRSTLEFRRRLQQRKAVAPADFARTLKLREDRMSASGYKPDGSTEELFPGTYYLVELDSKFRRSYALAAPRASL